MGPEGRVGERERARADADLGPPCPAFCCGPSQASRSPGRRGRLASGLAGGRLPSGDALASAWAGRSGSEAAPWTGIGWE